MKLNKIKLTSIILVFIITIIFVPSNDIFAKEDSKVNSQVSLSNKELWGKSEVLKLGYVPDEIIVKFNRNTYNLKSSKGRQNVEKWIRSKKNTLASNVISELENNDRLSATEKQKALTPAFANDFLREKETFDHANIVVFELSVNDVISETINLLSEDPLIDYAEPNYIITPTYTPNENFYADGQLWGLENDGSEIIEGDADNTPSYPINNPGTSAADIHINEAWNMLNGSESEIIIAILDSGADYNHEDLDDVMWSPAGSCYDENGHNIVGGCPKHGWNFYNNPSTNDPIDENGHGTHVAGIIAAEHSQTDVGILGVSKNTKIMAVKFMESVGTTGNAVGTTANAIKGINFARNNGAHIINASYDSGTSSSLAEKEAIEDFINEGGLFIASAGNNDDNIDSLLKSYPAAHSLDGANYDNLIAVAATDQADNAWNYTNYGPTSVDLGAPGVNILSTWINDEYRFLNGTSMAAPFVAGTAAMIWGYRPELTAQQVKLAIMESGDTVADLNPSTGSHPTVTGKGLDAYDALLATEGALVVPTIHSTTSGGNWSSASTWEGGVVPGANDVVEINGLVTLNQHPTISGLIVNSGSNLRPYTSGTYALTLSGDNADMVNNGSISPYVSGKINLVIGGHLENNGSVNVNTLDITGNLINSGTIYNTTWVEGDMVSNSGTVSGSLLLNGVDQTLKGGGSAAKLYVNNDVNLEGNLDVAELRVNSGHSLTYDSQSTIYVSDNLYNYADITGGSLILDGATQSISVGGTFNVDDFILSGSGTKTLDDNLTISGDLTIESGTTLRAYGDRSTHQVNIGGDMLNDGATSQPGGYSYGYIQLNITGDLENNGSFNHHYTYVDGDYLNNGTQGGISARIKSNVTNNGTISSSLVLDGIVSQTLNGAGAYGSLSVYNNVVLEGDQSIGKLTLDASKTLSFGLLDTLNVSGDILNSGVISGGDMILNGTTQLLRNGGFYDVESLTLSGSGAKTLDDDLDITGDFTINAGASLKAHGDKTVHQVNIGGNMLSNGSTSQVGGYNYGRFDIKVGDTLTNNANIVSHILRVKSDLINNGNFYVTVGFANWDPIPGVDSYEAQITDTSDVWQTEVPMSTLTNYNITSYLNDDRRWRWRSVTGGVPSAWSTDKHIN